MAAGTNRPIDGARLWRSLMEMAEIGATPKGGVRRLALSDVDRRGRDLFRTWCEAAGLSVRVDAIGNIRTNHQEDTLPSGRSGDVTHNLGYAYGGPRPHARRRLAPVRSWSSGRPLPVREPRIRLTAAGKLSQKARKRNGAA